MAHSTGEEDRLGWCNARRVIELSILGGSIQTHGQFTKVQSRKQFGRDRALAVAEGESGKELACET